MAKYHYKNLPPQEFDIWERPEHMWSDDSAELFKKKRKAIVFQPEELYNQTNFLCLNDRKISSQS
jgi:hypothetical protein